MALTAYRRLVIACVAVAVFIVAAGGVVLPQTAVGVIRGTALDTRTKKPLSKVQVTASSPGAKYTVLTDARGVYVILGVLPDTYVLSFTRGGYAPVSVPGVTVLAGTVQNFDVSMTQTLQTIASVRAHARAGAGSAFQPGMTTDNYTLTDQQIKLVQGKEFNSDENQLLRSIPSVTIDKTGTVSIRGGFAFEAAYEFEGIDYTVPAPNLQNTLQNIGNFSLLNGVGGVQLIPGGGDATHGLTGTGLVLLTAKHGTYPSYVHADLEMLDYPYLHQLGLEWGWADPSQRLSNYASFLGLRRAYQYGSRDANASELGTRGTNAASLGSQVDPNLVYYSPSFLSSNDFVDNLIYRFGKNNSQRFQFFIQSQSIKQDLDYGGFQNLFYASGGGAPGQCSQAIVGAQPIVPGTNGLNSNAQNIVCQSLVPLFPGQPSAGAYVTQGDQLNSPFLAYKFEYGANLGVNTLLTARYYRIFADQSQQLPSQGIFANPYGGNKIAGTLDVVSALGSKNLLKAGLVYGYSLPYGDRFDTSSYTAFTAEPQFVTFPLTHNGQAPPIGTIPPNLNNGAQGLAPDFFTPAQCQQAQNDNSLQPGITCGYLYPYIPNGSRFPTEHDVFTASQQTYAAYVQDDATYSDRWKSELGLRLDGFNFLFPDEPGNPPGIAGIRHQRLYEPHVNITYSPNSRDVFRLGYGRTLAIPLASQLGANVDPSAYNAFVSIPSFDNTTGKPATYCGVQANQVCANYAQQMYWLVRDYRYGAQSLTTALHGATFTNYDLSWAHLFRDGSAIKLTPFYRRGYDVIEQTAQIVGFNSNNGVPIYGEQSFSNLGQQKATGVEFLYNKDRAIGLSIQFGATYINQFGNEPPGTFLTPAALAAGELYHSPDLSPFQMNIATNYQFKEGLRIAPVVFFNIGYPYGAGYYTAINCGGRAFIVPNTDVNTFYSSATNYVDPEYPGSCTKPNIVGTRGNQESSLPGGIYSRPVLNVDLTFEYQRPGSNLVFGVQFQNLTNNLFNVPVQNTCYGIPVVTGLNFGSAPCTFALPQYGNPGPDASAGSPYLVYPNLEPLGIRLYVQAKVP